MFRFLEFDRGIAVRHQNGSLTYPELNRLLSLLRNRLQESGAQPGDRVALNLPNSLELLAGYYACLLGGFVAVPINERLKPREVERILRHAKPRIIVARPPRISESGAMWKGQAGPTGTVELLPLEGIHRWIGNSTEPRPAVRPDWPPRHPAALFYTSGSTGAPKGALYSHRTLIENARIYREALEISAADHSVVCHCLASNFMFSQVTVPFLEVGGTVEVVDFGSVDQTLRAIASGATFLSLIPWFGFQLLQGARTRMPMRAGLRACAVGGDRVPLSFFSEFKEVFGITPREFMGMTETNCYTVNPRQEENIKVGSAGTTFPDVRLQIRDPSGIVLPPGREGEIWVRTPGAMEGYWEDPERTDEVMKEGWFATGDLGYLDDDGYLWFSGRRKHIIICDGDNIHPREIEHEIVRHPLVRRACVIGIPHPTRGETVAAAVILEDPDAELTLEEISEFLQGQLSDTKIPQALLVLDRLPLTANGKIDRRAILSGIQRGR